MNRQLFVGPILYTDNDGKLVVKEKASILVENGKIARITDGEKFACNSSERVIVLRDGQFLIPGLIDAHIHAVQFPNLGLGYNKTLLDWLEKYTFPMERRYTDLQFAEKVFDAVVKTTLKNGTTTACYFASLYEEASLILAQKVAKYGQRAFIGKLSMNVPRKDGYYETTEDSVASTKRFIDVITRFNNPLIKPVITPRFALSCDMQLMKELGKLAKEKDVLIQTHVSENIDEIEAVKSIFKAESYVEVYDKANLLGSKTILAHGVHLTDDELDLLKTRDTAVINCSLSNTFLKSGLCDVKRLKDRGIKVGLGTDVAGGPSASIIEAMRGSLQVSNHLSLIKSKDHYLNLIDVFHMATLGGAKALSIDNQVGNFVPGKQFDALVIDLNVGDSKIECLVDNTLEEKLERFIYSGDDRNIVQVYVAGKNVKYNE